MSELTPPDYTRCQAMITPAYSAFQIGPRETPERCNNPPAWLGTEIHPGADGKCGQMTMCEDCAKVFRDTSPMVDRVEMTPIDQVKLSDRIRPTVESPPWVYEAIQELEVTLEAAQYGVSLWQDQASYWKALYEDASANDRRAMSYLEEIRTVVGKDLDWPGVVSAVQCLASNLHERTEFCDRLKSLWIGMKRERDALAAHVGRLRGEYATGGANWERLMRIGEVLNDAPTTSLARLKAEWQAEALQEIIDNLKRSSRGQIAVDDIKAEAGRYRRQAEGGEQ